MAATKGLNFKVSATAAGLSALSSFTKALSGIGSAGTVAKNSMQGFSSELRRQQQQYDAVSALAKTYAADAGLVDRALKLGAISTDQWAAATGRLKANWSAAEFAMLFDAGGSTGDAFLAKFNAELERLTLKFNPAKQAAATFDAAVLELNRALDLGAINVVEYQNALQKLPASTASVIVETDRMKLSFKSAADAASVFDTEFNRLQTKFNPASAAVQRLAQTEAELTRAMHLGAVSAEQYAIQMTELRNTATAAAAAQRQMIPATNSLGAAIDNHNRAVGSWNRGLKDTNRAIQQAGFQVGDFFIQVAGGQSIVLAFTQQAGQLIQFFGMWGSLAAAAIAIGGALWMMFGKGENATKKAADALTSLNSALSGFGRNAEIASTSVDELRKTYGQWADEVQATAKALLGVNLAQSITALRNGAMDATVALRGIYDAEAEVLYLQEQVKAGVFVDSNTIAQQTQAIVDMAAGLGMTVDQADRLYLAIGAMNGSTTWLEMEANSRAVSEILKGIYGTGTDIPPVIQEMWLKYGDVNTVLGQNLAIIDGTAAAAREVTNEVVQTTAATSGLATAFNRVIPSITAVVSEIGGGVAAMRTLVNSQPGQSWLANAMYRMDTLASKAWAAASAVASAMAGSTQSVAIGGAGRPDIDLSDMQYRGAIIQARVAIMQKAAADAAAAAGNVGGGGGGGATALEQVTTQVDGATEALKEMKSVADSISGAFMSAFSGVLKGTKSVKEAAMDMLNTVLDRTIELLMAPVFDGIAGFIGKSIFGAVGSLGALPSNEGGGFTGNGARSGGLDGKGGFLSIMHPKETVTDHTRGGGGMGGGGVTINVMVDGATGNGEIMEMVSSGVSAGLKYYDAKVLPQSLKRVSANPRRM